MRSITYFMILCLFVCVTCKNYYFGEKTNSSTLVRRSRVVLEAKPGKNIDTVYKFNDWPHLKIQAIYCYDYHNSEASVNLTDGGLGTHHYSLWMKTETSNQLDYTIETYQ